MTTQRRKRRVRRKRLELRVEGPHSSVIMKAACAIQVGAVVEVVTRRVNSAGVFVYVKPQALRHGADPRILMRALHSARKGGRIKCVMLGMNGPFTLG